ncbi:MAG: hypothetical protein KIT44_13560 [Opitutaceae bacterium]|nr:hypothetical protein [Opitutaceae bacterium]
MRQRITIDLNNNPEAVGVVADMEPGDRVELAGSIVSKDDQSLVLELDEIGEDSAVPAEETDDEEADDDSPAARVVRGDG